MKRTPDVVLMLPPLFRKTIGETVKRCIHQEGSGLISGDFQAKKTQICHLRTCFCHLDDASPYAIYSISRSPWLQKASRQSPTFPIHWLPPQWALFSSLRKVLLHRQWSSRKITGNKLFITITRVQVISPCAFVFITTHTYKKIFQIPKIMTVDWTKNLPHIYFFTVVCNPLKIK
jgi:hypothetical protein